MLFKNFIITYRHEYMAAIKPNKMFMLKTKILCLLRSYVHTYLQMASVNC